MKTVRIGNLKHNLKKCNCGNTAVWYIFTINENNNKTIFYKCKDCMMDIYLILNSINKSFN